MSNTHVWAKMNDTRVTTPFLQTSCTLRSLPLFVRRVVFARAPGATKQLLTADCISLVWTVGTLGLSVAAPASGDALSVLAGEVRGGARLLRCGDRRKGNTAVTSWASATQLFSRDLKGHWVTLDDEHLNVLQWGGANKDKWQMWPVILPPNATCRCLLWAQQV